MGKWATLLTRGLPAIICDNFNNEHTNKIQKGIMRKCPLFTLPISHSISRERLSSTSSWLERRFSSASCSSDGVRDIWHSGNGMIKLFFPWRADGDDDRGGLSHCWHLWLFSLVVFLELLIGSIAVLLLLLMLLDGFLFVMCALFVCSCFLSPRNNTLLEWLLTNWWSSTYK